MCHLAVVSRASYYRNWEVVAPDEAEMAVRASIQEVVLRHRRRYGYRRVTVDLRRQGMVINHKRVARILSLIHICSSWLSSGKTGFSSAAGIVPTFILDAKT